MLPFLTTLVDPFYVLFGSWNFFTMTVVGAVALAVIILIINLIKFH